MDPASVPLIFSPPVRLYSLDWRGRAAALALSGLALSMLVTASLLPPNPAGLGTHTALGFPSCSWYRILGFPCPFCGMTTSWAWFVRGNLAAAIWVQPMGALLATMAVFTFWAGLYIGISGRPAHRLLRYVPSGYIYASLLTVALLAWGWKIFLQARHLDGWL